MRQNPTNTFEPAINSLGMDLLATSLIVASMLMKDSVTLLYWLLSLPGMQPAAIYIFPWPAKDLKQSCSWFNATSSRFRLLIILILRGLDTTRGKIFSRSKFQISDCIVYLSQIITLPFKKWTRSIWNSWNSEFHKLTKTSPNIWPGLSHLVLKTRSTWGSSVLWGSFRSSAPLLGPGALGKSSKYIEIGYHCYPTTSSASSRSTYLHERWIKMTNTCGK